MGKQLLVMGRRSFGPIELASRPWPLKAMFNGQEGDIPFLKEDVPSIGGKRGEERFSEHKKLNNEGTHILDVTHQLHDNKHNCFGIKQKPI